MIFTFKTNFICAFDLNIIRDYNKTKGGSIDLPLCKMKFSRKGRMIKC